MAGVGRGGASSRPDTAARRAERCGPASWRGSWALTRQAGPHGDLHRRGVGVAQGGADLLRSVVKGARHGCLLAARHEGLQRLRLRAQRPQRLAQQLLAGPRQPVLQQRLRAQHLQAAGGADPPVSAWRASTATYRHAPGTRRGGLKPLSRQAAAHLAAGQDPHAGGALSLRLRRLRLDHAQEHRVQPGAAHLDEADAAGEHGVRLVCRQHLLRSGAGRCLSGPDETRARAACKLTVATSGVWIQGAAALGAAARRPSGGRQPRACMEPRMRGSPEEM
jgi:hypothetical protein